MLRPLTRSALLRQPRLNLKRLAHSSESSEGHGLHFENHRAEDVN